MSAEQNVNLERREFVKSLPLYILERIRGVLNDHSSRPRVATISVTRCLAWGNSLCQACYLACPLRDRAIEIVDQKPIINREICNGCGYCIPACHTVNDQAAIELVLKGGEYHDDARSP